MSLPLLTMHIINTRRFCPLTSLTSYLPSTSLSHLFLSATCIFRSPIQPHLSPLRACLRPLHVTCATILLSLVTRSLWCGRTDHIPKHIHRCGKLSSSPAADSSDPGSAWSLCLFLLLTERRIQVIPPRRKLCRTSAEPQGIDQVSLFH